MPCKITAHILSAGRLPDCLWIDCLVVFLLQPVSESDEEEEEENKEDGVVDRDYIKLRAAKMSHRLAQRK